MKPTRTAATVTRHLNIGEFESVDVVAVVEGDLDPGETHDAGYEQAYRYAEADACFALRQELKAAMKRRTLWPSDAFKNKGVASALLKAQLKAVSAELKTLED